MDGFGTEVDTEALVEMIMCEYAGDAVPDDPVELTKQLVEFGGDSFVMGLDKVARCTKSTPSVLFVTTECMSSH